MIRFTRAPVTFGVIFVHTYVCESMVVASVVSAIWRRDGPRGSCDVHEQFVDQARQHCLSELANTLLVVVHMRTLNEGLPLQFDE